MPVLSLRSNEGDRSSSLTKVLALVRVVDAEEKLVRDSSSDTVGVPLRARSSFSVAYSFSSFGLVDFVVGEGV